VAQPPQNTYFFFFLIFIFSLKKNIYFKYIQFNSSSQT
jgi:hypothetical protein